MFRLRSYEKGDVIFREGEPGESCFVIEHGRVEIVKNLDGRDVHLAYIGPGEPFGEMGIIDDRPRHATVLAAEPTTARELHRDDFLQNLQSNPEVAIRLLKVLFERLREADATILQLRQSQTQPASAYPVPVNSSLARSGARAPDVAVYLEGLTHQARQALPFASYQIAKFPFRIGRLTNDPLAHNDLSLADQEPLQISRSHLTIVKEGLRIGISDRGSRFGSSVDGKNLGGAPGNPTSIFITTPEATLVLGDKTSPYRFRIRLVRDA